MDEGEIRSIELWYCHNLPESSNVRHEIDSTVNSAKALTAQHWPKIDLEISGREIGATSLDEMFAATQLDIAVEDSFEFRIPGYFTEDGKDWDALCTTISGRTLHDLYQNHKSMLFALNVRDYLGLIKSDKNINSNMRASAVEQPDRFFAYNNGLTILTREWSVRRSGRHFILKIDGASIVNGAQTTGVLGNIQESESGALDTVRVLVRFVKSADRAVLEKIIEYNNSQNRVEAADFRSNDATQDRLRREFSSIPEADYRGGRRGGARDVIERPANLISTKTAAQALACFHGSPEAAYHEIGRIWSDNDYYLRTFDPKVTARHVVFCYSLLKSIESHKALLTEKQDRTSRDEQVLDFLRLRGGGFMLASAIAANMESIAEIAIANPWGLRFRENLSPAQAVLRWQPVVSSLASFSSTLRGAVVPNFRTRPRIESALDEFSNQLSALISLSEGAFADFASRVEYAAAVEH